jgi:uncharacterized protein YjbJ (UPF0337 family)
MNWQQVEGRWPEIKGRLRSRWPKLTDDDVGHLAGKRDMLVSKLRERYGIGKHEAETALDGWVISLSSSAPTQSEVEQARADWEGMGQSRFTGSQEHPSGRAR